MSTDIGIVNKVNTKSIDTLQISWYTTNVPIQSSDLPGNHQKHPPSPKATTSHSCTTPKALHGPSTDYPSNIIEWKRRNWLQNRSYLPENPQNDPLPVRNSKKQGCHVYTPYSMHHPAQFKNDPTKKSSKRDIVDTYLHASRVLGQARPNKGLFLIHGRKAKLKPAQ